MTKRLYLAGWVPVAAGLLALLAGCRHESVVVPALDDTYFPVEVGTYRTYAVQDTTSLTVRAPLSQVVSCTA